MQVKDLIKILEGVDEELTVVLADFTPVSIVEPSNYGNGCLIISDIEEEEEE